MTVSQLAPPTTTSPSRNLLPHYNQPLSQPCSPTTTSPSKPCHQHLPRRVQDVEDYLDTAESGNLPKHFAPSIVNAKDLGYPSTDAARL